MIPREWDAPLSVLGPDLTVQEWACRIGCSVDDVRDRCDTLGVFIPEHEPEAPNDDAPPSDYAIAKAHVVSQLEDWGAATIAQMVNDSGVPYRAVRAAVDQLRREGRIERVGNIGRGVGRPHAVYARRSHE